MTQETMNVHKALCELKILDSRIENAINACSFVEAKKVLADNIKGVTSQKFKENERDALQSIKDLIARRAAIKSAVVLSNATTKVTVGGVEYTVAEAIELKNHGMDGKRMLLNRMSSRLALTERSVELANTNAEANADRYVAQTLGGKDAKADEIAAVRETYLKTVQVEMVDGVPSGIKKELEKLEKEISDFSSEVDAALSTSNAITEISVEY